MKHPFTRASRSVIDHGRLLRGALPAFAALWCTAPLEAQATARTAPQALHSGLVNPFVGTDGHGHTHPAATLPFGMVQLGPDTRLEGWDGCSGYHWSDDRIFGFSHTHLSGTGVSDYGDILFMPGSGTVRLSNGAEGEPGYGSRFDKRTEKASPGYYRVHLEDPDVTVELTATARTGLHRYTFGSGEGHVVLDLAHRDPVLESWVRVSGPAEIEGLRRSRAWATDQAVYFVARFSKPFRDFGFALDLENPRAVSAGERIEGTDVRGVFHFDALDEEPLLLQVGLSAVDIDGARKNLEAEFRGFDFEATHDAARATWDEELSRVALGGGTRAQRRTFATALYHAFLAPNLFSDVDGRFRGMDGATHLADHPVYTVFSLWDTFRAAHPLFTLLQPERTVDFLRTFERHFETGGRLPVWELAGNETNCMIGYHAVPVIADAWLKGFTGFDEELLFEAMLESAEADVFGRPDYRRLGFLPADRESESVSKTLEYAYDDWCIARVAERLGREDVVARFDARARAFEHLFDPATGFLRARRNGSWIEPFDPREVNFCFTEANAWQYRFFVPHDIAGLTRLLGGEEAMLSALDELFTTEASTTGRDQADITGLIGQYAHGNEPSHHVAWLYSYLGRPWRTQELVERILTTLYDDTPAGLCGNEDCGQMSAWYVLGALGLYPVVPASNEYVLAAPLFESATLRLADDVQVRLEAPREASAARYVQAVSNNDEDWPRAAISHADLLTGPTLRFTLGSEPSDWGVKIGARPKSAMPAPAATPVPFVEAASPVFRGSTRVVLRHADPAAVLHYTLDGSLPKPGSTSDEGRGMLYREPLVFEETTELRVVATLPGRTPSVPIEAHFHALDHDWSLTVETPYSPQYTAGGDIALIDGLRGGTDFRTGSWQGYLGTDACVVLDLGRVRNVQSVGVGFLQETRSWIWMPSALELEVSLDGEHYAAAGSARPETERTDPLARTEELVIGLPDSSTGARYLRLTARSPGPIPGWHVGRGNPGWIFTDEIRLVFGDGPPTDGER